MSATKRGDLAARVVGAGLGVGLAALIVLSARPAGTAAVTAPASVSFSVINSGAIAVAPAEPRRFLSAQRLHPGRPVSGVFSLTNQTGRTVAVRLRTDPSGGRLQSLVHLRLMAADQRLLADTKVAALRATPARALSLRPGQTSRLRARAWIEPGADVGYPGRRLDVVLTPEEHVRGSS